MRSIQMTITFQVEDTATDEDIDRMVGYAAVQIEEPTDEDGEDAVYGTSYVVADWFEVKV